MKILVSIFKKKTLGTLDKPKGRQVNSYNVPFQLNLRYLLEVWWIGIEKYAFKSTEVKYAYR